MPEVEIEQSFFDYLDSAWRNHSLGGHISALYGKQDSTNGWDKGKLSEGINEAIQGEAEIALQHHWWHASGSGNPDAVRLRGCGVVTARGYKLSSMRRSGMLIAVEHFTLEAKFGSQTVYTTVRRGVKVMLHRADPWPKKAKNHFNYYLSYPQWGKVLLTAYGTSNGTALDLEKIKAAVIFTLRTEIMQAEREEARWPLVYRRQKNSALLKIKQCTEIVVLSYKADFDVKRANKVAYSQEQADTFNVKITEKFHIFAKCPPGTTPVRVTIEKDIIYPEFKFN
ncbi:hypothetical protein SCHPADRAFT_897053 [Schizopora paradoxa]|uniref:Uncharacterized protein n=1 Tax=Schizopora paradoxa TaxID=27342 RepID=A0A0H2QYF2_9AGAM|nr:hypothetical protein SCHPADRAFT_897053 [Schizopora paradoxa]